MRKSRERERERRMAEVEDDEGPVIPGLPAELGKLCLAKLSTLQAVARSRIVCRAWASVLSKYPHRRCCPDALACFVLGHEDDCFFTWLFLSREHLRTHHIPSFFSNGSIFTSRMQVIPTGTPLLLVRSTLLFGADKLDGGYGAAGAEAEVPHGGFLQGFDLWHMRWLQPREIPWRHASMPVDRWAFASAHVDKHVYFAGGHGRQVANTAERLSLETWTWETLPPMHMAREYQPSGFGMNGRFFVVGGESHHMSSTLPKSGEFYDPIKESWTLVPHMWPHKLWYTSGAPQSITVFHDVAYAIDAESQEVLHLRVEEDQPLSVKWQVVGKLPWAGFCNTTMLSMQCLASDGNNKLWAMLKNRGDHQWFVFACIPNLVKQELEWECLHFDVPASSQSLLSSRGMGISI